MDRKITAVYKYCLRVCLCELTKT